MNLSEVAKDDLKVVQHQLELSAVEIRYPDDLPFPSIKESERAFEIAQEVKDFILEKLKLS